MFKQILIIILLSILAVLFAKELSYILHLLANGRDYVSHLLAYVFSGDKLGRLIREVVVLAGIPIVIAMVANMIYWLIKKRTMPIFTAFMWLIWILLIAAIR